MILLSYVNDDGKEISELTKQSTLPAYIELFDIDCTDIPGLGAVYRFTPNINYEAGVYSNVMFGGDAYTPFPIEITGYSQNSDGAPARPTLRIANVNKLFGMLSFVYADLIGAKVTYYRTFKDYLNTSVKKSAAPLKFTISRKASHNMSMVTFELRSPLDKERMMLPRRQMLKRDFPGLGINKVF